MADPPPPPLQPLAPGNFDRAWNDPPLFSYNPGTAQVFNENITMAPIQPTLFLVARGRKPVDTTSGFPILNQLNSFAIRNRSHRPTEPPWCWGKATAFYASASSTSYEPFTKCNCCSYIFTFHWHCYSWVNWITFGCKCFGGQTGQPDANPFWFR